MAGKTMAFCGESEENPRRFGGGSMLKVYSIMFGVGSLRKRGLMFLGAAILSNAGANVLIKMGMASRGEAVGEGMLPALLAIALNPIVAGGFFFFALTFVLYSVALSSLDLSYAYPLMTGGALLLIFGLSTLFLGESLSLLRFGGMLLIMGGITVVSLKG
jgi:multidrug transporter EmrE-like cation transporter